MRDRKKSRIGVGRPKAKEGRPPLPLEERIFTKPLRVRPEVYDYVKLSAEKANKTMGDFIASELDEVLRLREEKANAPVVGEA